MYPDCRRDNVSHAGGNNDRDGQFLLVCIGWRDGAYAVEEMLLTTYPSLILCPIHWLVPAARQLLR